MDYALCRFARPIAFLCVAVPVLGGSDLDRQVAGGPGPGRDRQQRAARWQHRLPATPARFPPKSPLNC